MITRSEWYVDDYGHFLKINLSSY